MEFPRKLVVSRVKMSKFKPTLTPASNIPTTATCSLQPTLFVPRARLVASGRVSGRVNGKCSTYWLVVDLVVGLVASGRVNG